MSTIDASASTGDYIDLNNFSVFFGEGQATVGILFQILDDQQCEDEEYFWVYVSENNGVPVDASPGVRITITDDDCKLVYK